MSQEKAYPTYPIGTPGKPWGEEEKKEWLKRITYKRDYFTEVVSKVHRLDNGEVFQYGELNYLEFGSGKFPLYAIKSSNWDPKKKVAVVTGGVHGYETSGVQGAILFAKNHLHTYTEKGLNVLVLVCISPWGYEHINRWNPLAIDPNRQFNPENPGCSEAAAAMKCINEHVTNSAGIVMHIDLHETTDTDNTEFRPAYFARDGKEPEKWSEIPPGFYLVANSHTPEPEFQKAMIDSVEKVTKISPPDEEGNIIGEKQTDKGVITIPGKKWGICGAHTGAQYCTTTEVYPDAPGVTDDECNRAQEACVVGGLDYVLAHL